MALNGVSRWIGQPANFFGLQIAKAQASVRGQLYLEPMDAQPTDATNEGAIAWDGAINSLVQNDGTAYRPVSDRYYVRHTNLLVADQVDQNIFIADRKLKVKSIEYVATTPESAGTLTLIVRRCQGVEAPASGDALHTAGNMVGAACVTQTVYTPALTATTAHLTLEDGDRLALDYTDDVAGELAGVCVTVVLEAA